MKISKFLRGISAFIIAGVLSFMPTNQVKAIAPYSYAPTTNIYYTDGTNVDTSNSIGTATWSVTGVDSSNSINDDPTNIYDGQIFYVIENNGALTLLAGISHTNDLNDGAAGSVSFSFTYNGKNFSGSFSLISEDRDMWNFYYISLTTDESSEFSRSINEKVNDIDMAFKGLNPDGTVNATKTVEYVYNGAVSKNIIDKLAHADGVTLLYTFEYEGYVFTSVISSADAAKIFSKDIPWYGPCYIASNCPTVMVGVAK